MANTDKTPTVSPQLTGQEEHGQAGAFLGRGGEGSVGLKRSDDSAATVPTAADTDVTERSINAAPVDSQPILQTTRPSLVQLGSGGPPTTSPHPKRFSAVNINKKFLQKNSSSSVSPPVSSGSATSKPGGPLSRPQAQPSTSHSRLVTTKLTAVSPASSASGAGWSRPSSAAPPNATGSHSPNSTSPLPQTPAAVPATSTSGPTQLPRVGKVIQPQPRAILAQQGPSHKDTSGGGSSKPVWGNVKPHRVAHQRSDVPQNDFPTAAEVAQVATSVRNAKINDSKEAAETAAANKQARLEEADTFRGVHLDPNAHHWDEMEEDDDNFLDGVIEFGDGRQYKIESADPPAADSSLLSESMTSLSHSPTKSRSRLDDIEPLKDPASAAANVPVSKEERFADDFDRSWPRSRTSPALSAREFPSTTSGQFPVPTGTALPAAPLSPVITQPLHSPQESSRVLFNERSNKLEPYSNAHRSGPGQYPSKRGNHQDFSSPTESRSTRDLPAASPSHNNIQLLQKPGNADFPARPRGSGESSGGSGPGPSNTHHADRQRDWDRDQPLRRDGPPSPRISREGHHSGKDRDLNIERGRRSAMGPPPPPAHSLRGLSKDGGRQMHPGTPVPPRISSRDSKFQTAHGEASAPNSARPPSQSPALSHTSAALISPAIGITSLPLLSAPELDEVRKDVMQSAAARAKQRRQQEEEEREKEKDRARRKAAELEERIKAAEAERAKSREALEASKSKDEAVITIIEEAIKSVELPKQDLPNTIAQPQSALQSSVRPNMRRPPSLKGPVQPTSDSARQPASRRTSTSNSVIAAPLVSPTVPAVQAESWRSKATPLPPLVTSRQAESRPPMPTFLQPSSTLEQVRSFVGGSDEDLEVVDFSEMGKFVGVSDVPEPPAMENKPAPSAPEVARSSRPHASDFFNEGPWPAEPPAPAKDDAVTWRQKHFGDPARRPSVSEQGDDLNQILIKDIPRKDLATDTSLTSDATSTTSTKDTSVSADHHHIQAMTVPPHIGTGVQRTPRSQAFYKEAAMSALDDAMSRIKGALDGMQAGDTTKEGLPSVPMEMETSTTRISLPTSGKSSSQTERWIPPALRSRSFEHEACEAQTTVGELPQSPRPAWDALIVRLPAISQPLDPIHKRQLQLSTKSPYQVRLDILSFDPPVEGMSRRDLSINEILFRKQPGGYKGKPRYRVSLPRFRPSTSGPRVNIPAHVVPSKSSGVGAFGRPTGADGLTTWRKAALPSPANADPGSMMVAGLSTISRSPPPDLLHPDPNVASIPRSDSSASAKTDQPTRSRSQPKMPAGSAVAFYRDSRIDTIEADPKNLVNFIVTSELEEARQGSQIATPIKPQPNITVTSPPYAPSSNSLDPAASANTSINGRQSSPSVEHATPSLVHTKAESKSSDDSTDRVPITPPSHHTAPWTRPSLNIPLKESPARGPDPEHLKAVWSQTSNKAGMHAVNSLEGIADDLTALPFTLQDVKSEDGETPPPSISTAPSRMSLHEVTRAFQQVPSPSSSSSTSQRGSSSTAPPVVRPPGYAYTLPPPALPPNPLRPTYAAYPSPLMSHSPNPTVMYPHPMTSSPTPGRMPVNGHTPLYSQPMWMSMPGPSPQNPNSMMRPMTSPYPAQLMPYPSPGTPAMYAPPPGNMQQPQAGVQSNRGRSISVMSPVMQHAGPQMYGSPVLMHAPVLQVQQNHSYMPMPTGRGQARPDNGQMQMQHTQSPNQHPPPHAGFNPVPASSFVRSTW